MLDMYGIIIIFVFCLLYFFLFLLGKWTSGKYGMTFIFFMFFITFFWVANKKVQLSSPFKVCICYKKKLLFKNMQNINFIILLLLLLFECTDCFPSKMTEWSLCGEIKKRCLIKVTHLGTKCCELMTVESKFIF